jgi:hypothetical protein
LIKIITGYENTPVVIADTDIEDSFDVQGRFIGKLPFDPDSLGKEIFLNECSFFIGFTILVAAAPRRPLPEPQQPPPPPRSQPALITVRQPSQSALRSMAATTTVNTFVSKMII